jgi:hypothetical protein
MAKLKKYESVVHRILEKFSSARSSDGILQYKVCEELNPDVLKETYGNVLLYGEKLGVPNENTVSRCRRKLQEKHPELKNSETAKIRAAEQEDYKSYAHT